MRVVQLPLSGHVFHPGSVRALTPLQVEAARSLHPDSDYFSDAGFTAHGVGFSVDVRFRFHTSREALPDGYKDLPLHDKIRLEDDGNQKATRTTLEEAQKWYDDCIVAIFGATENRMFEDVLAKDLSAGDSISLDVGAEGQEVEVCTITCIAHTHNIFKNPVVRIKATRPNGQVVDVCDFKPNATVSRRLVNAQTP